MTLLAVGSEIAREVDRDFWLVGGVAIGLLVGITAAMLFFAVRYRRSRARTVSQVGGHLVLEVIWIIVPVCIVSWMFTVGFQAFQEERTVPKGAMTIRVTARRWVWSFHYPDEGIDSHELVVPLGQPVKMEISSLDVVHGFYIPDFRLKEDAMPGRVNHLWFKADREGTYHIFCSQYCGKDHSGMLTTLRVVTPRQYLAWIDDQIARRYRPLVFEAVTDQKYKAFGPADLNLDGNTLYQTYCVSCHGPAGDGTGLAGARNFVSPADWKLSPKVTDIFRTLTDGVANSQMRPFPNLTPWEKVALAHRVREFLKPAPPTDTRADYDGLIKQYELDKIQPPKRPLPIERAMELLIEQRGGTTQPSSRPEAPAAGR